MVPKSWTFLGAPGRRRFSFSYQVQVCSNNWIFITKGKNWPSQRAFFFCNRLTTCLRSMPPDCLVRKALWGFQKRLLLILKTTHLCHEINETPVFAYTVRVLWSSFICMLTIINSTQDLVSANIKLGFFILFIQLPHLQQRPHLPQSHMHPHLRHHPHPHPL